MEAVVNALKYSPLFAGISDVEIEKALQGIHFKINNYSNGEIIAFSGDECRALQIVLKGSVRGEMMDMTGRVLKIEDIGVSRPLAVAFLFGQNNRYPVTITANEDVSLLHLSKDSVVKLIQKNESFLTNFMNAVSNRAQFISGKLKFLSFQSLRGKLAHFLMEMDRNQTGFITLSKTQEDLAELFGVARPSLSRTLRELHHEGIIRADGKRIEILNRSALQDCLIR
jgi:CRP/FNR family transcriptional regulator, dissimilatory nitrate respiration regulator